MIIYGDYDQEPEDSFEPLPEELYCRFYDLEMEGYTEDARFWVDRLPMGHLLELGCGSGRLSRYLAQAERSILGIDRSAIMLRRAREKNMPLSSSPTYVQMDMCCLAFSCRRRFDALLIPYNTLNLLADAGQPAACLAACHPLLAANGRLAVQLYIFNRKFLKTKEKTFQFQLFDLPDGGRLIKEIRKWYNPLRCQVEVEERYRVRPMQQGKKKRDYAITYPLSPFTEEMIVPLFAENGWHLEDSWGDFQGKPYSGGGRWLGVFSPLPNWSPSALKP